MQFGHPIWILLGFATSLTLSLLIRRLHRQRQERLDRFAGPQLVPRLTRNISARMRATKTALLLIAIFLLFVTIAAPRYGYRWIEVKRKGIDILFALDTSKSMLAQDLRPNRLERAKLGILDFIEGLEGDRVGLMPFAGDAFLMTPLTLDYQAFQTSLASVDTAIIPSGGTNLTGVIEEARTVLNNNANHKILLLLTDGENLEGDAVLAAKKANEEGVTIYTVGIGTEDGELIPAAGGTGFIKDSAGQYVTSRLDRENLTAIAEATGGTYAPLGNSGEGLATIYQQKLSLIPKEDLAERKQRVPVERFGWPLAAALILLVLEYLLPERKPSGNGFPSIITSGRRLKKLFVLALLLPALLASIEARASKGEDAYNNGDFLAASEIYAERLKKEPDNPLVHYNYGTAAFKNNLFDEAISSFGQAIKDGDLALQQKAYYNRGNAHFKKGEETMQADPKKTISQWENAIDSFNGALALDPGDLQADQNRRFVQKKLEELQQQQQEQQQEQQDNGQDGDQQGQQQKQAEDQDDHWDGQKKEESPQTEQSAEQPNQQSPGNDQQNGEDNQNPAEQQQSEQRQETKQHPEQQQAQEQLGEQGGAEAGAADQQNEKLQQLDPAKMSEEEAEALLNLMKNSEGELNFVPRFQTPGNSSGRDW